MNTKILCVDDEKNVLDAYRRQLRSLFQVETAQDGEAGLQAISRHGPFAVVLSDLQMIGMDGVEFLAKVKEIAPDTVRIMLTGRAEIWSMVEAVNQGNVFRFLTKPCSAEDLIQALHAGIDQYRLITAEKVLLEETLKGSIRVLTEILSTLDPQSFGRACTLRDQIKVVAQELKITDAWELELAAMLGEIGRVTVPAAVIEKERAAQPLSEVEQEMLTRVPEIGHKLLANIPRLEMVAEMVLFQNKHFDGSGFPPDTIAGEEIPLGARIIKALLDLNQLESTGIERNMALEILKARPGWYDPLVLDGAFLCLAPSAQDKKAIRSSIRSVTVKELKVGQILMSDLVNTSGVMLIGAGNWISESLLEKIRNFARLHNIQAPIKVKMLESE